MKPEAYKIERANLEFDVYGYKVHIVFTNDLQRARNEYDGEELIGYHWDTEGALAFHAYNRHKNSHVSYVFFRFGATPETIAHESWHVINRMFTWLGIKEEDNEVTAYHLGHLVGQIHSFQRAAIKESKWQPVEPVKNAEETSRSAKKLKR